MNNPIANSDQFAAEADVTAMRSDPQVEQARATIEYLFALGFRDRIPEESKALLGEFCEEYLTNWLFKAAASDAQHPRFVRDFMPAYNWHGHDVLAARTGGDNPDNCYRLVGIEHGTAYQISGRIIDRKPANVTFTLTANYGTSVTVQTIEDHQLTIDPDGRFTITIDDTPADGRTNHLTTRPGVKFLFVRDSMMDWANETPLELFIKRLGDAKAGPLSRQDMAARAIEHAIGDLYLYFWFQNTFSGIKPNTVTEPDIPQGGNGGLVTQGSAVGNFVLGPDDAAIIDYDPAGAGYAAIQLTEWLFRSLDYHRIQSSLTAAQSATDGDGRIRVVVARRDPGVANWLDTGGQSRVFTIHRWQAMKADGRPLSLVLRLTTLDQLKSELPTETIWVSPEERNAKLQARRSAYRRRIE